MVSAMSCAQAACSDLSPTRGAMSTRAAAQGVAAGHDGQHGLVQLHVEMQHGGVGRQSGAGGDGRVHPAGHGHARGARDARGEAERLAAQRAGHRDHCRVARRGDLGPQARQVQVREIRRRAHAGRRARQRLERQRRPEAVHRQHRLEAQHGGRLAADRHAGRVEQRDAGARRRQRAALQGHEARVHQFQRDERHVHSARRVSAPAGCAAASRRDRSRRRARAAPAQAAGSAAGTSAAATASARRRWS
jgi:hypothetical protein